MRALRSQLRHCRFAKLSPLLAASCFKCLSSRHAVRFRISPNFSITGQVIAQLIKAELPQD